MNTLSDLISPGNLKQFIFKVWKKNSFLIKGHAKKFHDLFDLEKFYSAIRYGENEKPSGYRLSKLVDSVDRQLPTMTSEVILVDELGTVIDAGNTVCVTHIDLCDEHLSAFANTIRNELHYIGEVQVNCYLSPECSGANLHFDSSLGLILQIEGKKTWKYSEKPAIDWPQSNAQVNAEGRPLWILPFAGNEEWETLPEIHAEEFREVTLKRGDLLCLPAGVWHSANAVGYSLALTISIKPLDHFTLFMRLIYDRFQPDADWRSGPIPFIGNFKDPAGNREVISHWNNRLEEIIHFLEELQDSHAFFASLYTADETQPADNLVS